MELTEERVTEGIELKEFEQAYIKYNIRIRNLLFRKRIPRDLVDDLLQSAWCKAWEKRSNFRRECKLWVWVCTIALRLHLSEIRTSRYKVDSATDHKEVNVDGEAFLQPTEAIVNKYDMEKSIGDKLLVQKMLAIVTPSERARLISYHIQGVSIKESVKATPSQVYRTEKVRIHRSIVKIRDEFNITPRMKGARC